MTATRSTRQRDVIARVLDGAEGPLAVGDVLIRSEGSGEPVARAALTYSIPPKSRGN